jgi:hypothetical protein
MPDNWTLTWTDGNGRPLSKNYDNEPGFASAALDLLNDLRSSKIAAVLPNGTKLDEAALKANYVK